VGWSLVVLLPPPALREEAARVLVLPPPRFTAPSLFHSLALLPRPALSLLRHLNPTVYGAKHLSRNVLNNFAVARFRRDFSPSAPRNGGRGAGAEEGRGGDRADDECNEYLEDPSSKEKKEKEEEKPRGKNSAFNWGFNTV